jgi:hypothetical protein
LNVVTVRATFIVPPLVERIATASRSTCVHASS